MPTAVPEGRFFTPTDVLPPMVSYAQNFEDVTLRRGLRDIEHGFWVDIGAQHPRHESVTHWFSTQGWSGINVEPNPAFLRLLEAARPRDVNLGVAVGERPDRLVLNVIGDTGLSTLFDDLAAKHARAGLATTARLEVPVVTLDDLLERHVGRRTIDFLKIDAEGAETAIVRGASFARHRPRILVLEDNGTADYQPLLLERDYHFVWFDGLNRFYVRAEDAWRGDLVARPPNLWDNARHWAAIEVTSDDDRVRALQNEMERLRHEITGLRSSTSWRLMRPLRTLARYMGR